MDISRLQYYREQKGYSYETLSQLSKVPLGTIQKIFRGETKSPRHTTLAALEKVLLPSAEEYEKINQSHMVCESIPNYGSNHEYYTLEDYYALPEERRVELIDGVFYDMSSPSSHHQITSMFIGSEIRNYVKKQKGKCVVFLAPMDVQLDQDNKTMIQPDMMVVCDKRMIHMRCIYGAPDFVLEVVSESSKRRDAILKLNKYRNAGVREYWIVDPYKKRVIVYYFEEDELPTIYSFEDTIPVKIYKEELRIDFTELIEELDALSI